MNAATNAPPPSTHGHGAPLGDPLEELQEACRRHKQGAPPWKLFDRRIATHHEATRGLASRTLTGGDATAAIARTCNAPLPDIPRTIYLHTPYCPSLCTFCAFFRQPRNGADLDVYTRALSTQLAHFGNTPWARLGDIHALYFGGGTPTVLEPRHFEELLSHIRCLYALSPDIEITVESRCHGTDREYWERLCAAGVNRVSLGVQSFDTDVRRRVGRISNTAEIEAMVRQLRDAGISTISVDLIYNLPGQTPETFARDLRRVDALGLDGASIYSLIPFPRSTLMKRIEEGKEPPLGDAETAYGYFAQASEFFAARTHWKRASPVHFVRDGQDQNVYNRVRSGRSDVLGIGSGAGSRIGNVAFMNHMTVDRYLESQDAGEPGHAKVFSRPSLGRTQEALSAFPESLHLELDGSPEVCSENISALLRGLHNSGLAQQAGRHWKMTEAGCYWSYNVASIINTTIQHEINSTN